MAQVSSGVFPKSFFRGDCGFDWKCSLKKGCKSECASDRAAQMRGKVFLGRDKGSTSVFKSLATRQRLLSQIRCAYKSESISFRQISFVCMHVCMYVCL